jgi:hypothetical protein
MSSHFTIRPMTADEVPWVFDSWLNSWRMSRYAGIVRNNDYYATTRTAIEDLIARGAQILVADAGPTLLGWICGEVKNGTTVHHYCYVKDPYLQLGIEESLLAALPGVKPGFFTFYQHRLGKDRVWRHAPEMARRKTL